VGGEGRRGEGRRGRGRGGEERGGQIYESDSFPAVKTRVI
jgi:hypothetical protein